MQKKHFGLACLIIITVLMYWFITVEKESRRSEVIPDENITEPGIVNDPVAALENWQLDDDAFFVEYRLQRDRVRGQELELLTDFIDNPNTSPDGKQKAEEQLLQLVNTMEKELLVENLVKAQGYQDAVYFQRDNKANLVVKARNLTPVQFAQLTELVANLTRVNINDVIIVENPGD
ncbi:MAG TPA: SpoIIIAH-like family protein [Firmicutes bacterium]|nr:SpoIIIAH-like family protein [Bacillota bacterium]